MTKVQASAADPYARITGRILEQLKQGVRPWTKPWSVDQLEGRVTRPLRATGEPYHGINVLLLWMEAVAAGHASSTWMTYRQAQALGGVIAEDVQKRTLSNADAAGWTRAQILAGRS